MIMKFNFIQAIKLQLSFAAGIPASFVAWRTPRDLPAPRIVQANCWSQAATQPLGFDL